MSNQLRSLSSGLLLAGAVLVLLGLWFLLVRAGLPYQDPTPEMNLRWLASYEAGRLDLCWGGGMLALGGVTRFLGGRRRGKKD